MRALVFVLAIAAAGASQAQTPPKETLVQKLLRIAGLTAAPSQLRAPGDVEPGDIWISDVERRMGRALTQGGMYLSPIFEPGDAFVFALRDDVVVRIPAGGGAPEDRGQVARAKKLVGFDGPDDLVVLIDAAPRASPLVALSLKTGRANPLPHNPESKEEQNLLAFAQGSERVYGDTRVYTRTESRRGLSRTIEWTDVFLVRGGTAPVNVSSCDGANCGQPALSNDRRRVAYVKSAQ
jgi:hypothetical protein